MTLLFFDGMQDGATQRKPEWDIGSNWNTTATGRDGSTNGAVNTSGGVTRIITPSSACATCILGSAFIINNAGAFGSANNPPWSFLRAGTTELVVVFSASGFLEVRRTNATGTLLGTSSGHAAITLSVWHHLQVKVVLAAASAGSCELMLNGVSVLALSGVTTAGTSGSVSTVGIGGASGASNNYMSWDDIYLCDGVDATATQGRANNDFLGDLKVSTLIPSANGDLTAWSKSTGTNAAALVDEIPPNTTDYIFSSTAAQRELMALGDLSASAGLVYGARVCLWAAKSDAGASSVKTLVKEAVSGTITAGSSMPLSTTYTGYAGSFMWGKPTTPTTPWTATEVNALQAGVELT